MIKFIKRLFCFHIFEYEQGIDDYFKVCRKCDKEVRDE